MCVFLFFFYLFIFSCRQRFGTGGLLFFFINRGGLVDRSLKKKKLEICFFPFPLKFYRPTDFRSEWWSWMWCVRRHHAMPPIPHHYTTIAQRRLPVTNSSFDSDLHVCGFLFFLFVGLFCCCLGCQTREKHVMQESRMTQEKILKS